MHNLTNNFTSGNLSYRCTYTHMIKIIHCSITCNSKRPEIIQASELVKLMMVKPCCGILCSYKLELGHSLCTEMEWAPRYTGNYKRARCRTVFTVSMVQRTFKCTSICFEKLWRIHKKLLSVMGGWGIVHMGPGMGIRKFFL